MSARSAGKRCHHNQWWTPLCCGASDCLFPKNVWASSALSLYSLHIDCWRFNAVNVIQFFSDTMLRQSAVGDAISVFSRALGLEMILTHWGFQGGRSRLLPPRWFWVPVWTPNADVEGRFLIGWVSHDVSSPWYPERQRITSWIERAFLQDFWETGRFMVHSGCQELYCSEVFSYLHFPV